jgi:hypothetical protein
MTRKRSARLLLLSGLTLALGCRTAPPPAQPMPAGPDVLLSASPTLAGPPLVMTGPTFPLGESRPFKANPGESTLPMPTPVKPPDRIPPASTLEVKTGPTLPPLPPVLAPVNVAAIPPAVKPEADAPPVIAPIPTADVKHPNRDVFTTGSKTPVVPFELSIVGSPKDTSPPAAVFPLKAGEKFGHASDYKWVAGVLDRHQKGGYWTIRYADFAEDDRWGGKVRLLDDAKLKEFQSGDVVLLEGELLAPTSAADAAGAFPPYRVTGAKLVEKSK